MGLMFMMEQQKNLIYEKAVLKGYHMSDGLWCIPLKEKIENKMTNTLLFQMPIPTEATSHVFELPCTEKKPISMQQQDSQQRNCGSMLFEPGTSTHGLAYV